MQTIIVRINASIYYQKYCLNLGVYEVCTQYLLILKVDTNIWLQKICIMHNVELVNMLSKQIFMLKY